MEVSWEKKWDQDNQDVEDLWVWLIPRESQLFPKLGWARARKTPSAGFPLFLDFDLYSLSVVPRETSRQRREGLNVHRLPPASCGKRLTGGSSERW